MKKKNQKKEIKQKETKIETVKKESEPKKTPKWFYAVPFLIPIILIVLLELSLRLFGYGKNVNIWAHYHPELPGKIVMNPDFAYNYFFTTKGIPTSILDPFDRVKKPGTFRVFVLGESSSAGFPYEPNGSFSRYLRDRLELVYPNTNIEVVNLSMAAINSIVIRDFLPEALKYDPDLILLYVGHNEYYGVLGTASQSFLAGNKTLISLMLDLNKFKTVQLLRNTLSTVSAWFEKKEKKSSGTLMARMARSNLVPYQSALYKDGIKQFDGMLNDIVQMIHDKNIPLIMGTLTSNLKDQPPFVSEQKNGESANEFYQKGKEELQKSNTQEAKQFFMKAKELDELRFRAPEEMNDVIKKVASEYNVPLIDFETIFNSISKDGIVGSNLMVDHLHPNLHGYQIFGKLFFEAMQKNNFLPHAQPENISNEQQDSLVVAHFPFSRLDSTISNYRLTSLKGDFPFNKGKSRIYLNDLVTLRDINDSVAYKVVAQNYYWEGAHKIVGNAYARQKDYNGVIDEYGALIGQFPFTMEFQEKLITILLEGQRYADAYSYLEKYYHVHPDAFCTKWMGSINLLNNKYDEALKYFTESLTFDPTDPQLLWNISGVYIHFKKYEEGLLYIDKCLNADPRFPGARELKAQLLQAERAKH